MGIETYMPPIANPSTLAEVMKVDIQKTDAEIKKLEDEIAILSDLQKECAKIVMQNMNLLEPAEAPEEIPEMRRELYSTPNAVIDRPIPPRYLPDIY